MKKRLKVNGVIIGFAAVVVAFFPRFFFRSYSGGYRDAAIEVLGFSLIFLGQIIRVSARAYKAEHSNQSQSLICSGPYQVVRNPMYLGIFLIGLGVVLAVFKWPAVVIFVLIFILRYLTLIYKEEAKLLKTFPDTYKKYCKDVPRILPALSSIIKLDISDYMPLKLFWFEKEIGSIITLLLFVLLVRSWMGVTQVGLLAYLQNSLWLFLTVILFTFFIILLSRRRTKRKNSHGADKN
jgi:protein-S-isoprenylcysteine O-methyltransferase Ste14